MQLTVQGISVEIQLALLQIFGILAAVATLLVWRAKTTQELRQTLRLTQMLSRRGFRKSDLGPSWIVPVGQACVRVVAVVASICTFYFAFQYLVLVTDVVPSRNSLDLALVNRLLDQTVSLNSRIVRSGFVSIGLLIFDAVVWFVFHRRSVLEMAVPKGYHTVTCEPGWEESVEALWEKRAGLVSEWERIPMAWRRRLDAIEDDILWREELADWSRVAVSHQLQTLDDARFDPWN